MVTMNDYMHGFTLIEESLQLIYNHCTYCDPIEAWLENSFHTRFPINNNFLFLHLLKIVPDSFHFDFYILVFLFFTCDVHVFVGLSLHVWLHWLYDFT